jgi:hypothetical protein
MGERGVTRPMAMELGHGEDPEERLGMLREHHRKTLWVYWTVVLLGLWMVVQPFTFGLGVGAVEPSGGREVWLSFTNRLRLNFWSDLVSGSLLVVFGWRGLTFGRPVSLWVCASVGLWLGLAPLLFWAPTAAAYLNATLVGALVIALTVLIPGMPHMIVFMRMGGDQPPGWSYNPSSWAQRSILIALAFVGWLISRHLAAYQLGYIDGVWEPFFADGSLRVLDSGMSHALFVSDAGLGAFAYTLEFLMAWMGSSARWRTMPWMVALFGILVIPLGLVHIFLVISQPLVVGAWCSLCLLAAAIMLPMIALTVDEVIAMSQHLAEARRRGESLWRTFWLGGSAESSQHDERSPAMVELPQRPGRVLRASLWGFSVPGTLGAATLLGIWLMLTPAMFGLEDRAGDGFHLIGALIIVVAVIALGEPLRALRYLNLPLGLAAAVLPWLLEGGTTAGAFSGAVAGALVALSALPRGPVRERYGTWDRLVV